MIIIGAKGFAKQLVEIFFQSNRRENLFFYDDVSEESNDSLFEIRIIRNVEEALVVFKTVSNHFCLGIGNPITRKFLSERFEDLGGELCTVISPNAYLSAFVKDIGLGSSILTGAVIENDARIGKGTLINVNAVIHHDVNLGEYCEIAPGAKILGNVHIGNNCIVGTNSVILPNVQVGNNVIVGAGAVVTKDIGSNKIMVGVPAEELVKHG